MEILEVVVCFLWVVCMNVIGWKLMIFCCLWLLLMVGFVICLLVMGVVFFVIVEEQIDFDVLLFDEIFLDVVFVVVGDRIGNIVVVDGVIVVVFEEFLVFMIF